MKNFESKILIDLFKSTNGLFAYTFFERYKVEPDEIASFIEKYEAQELIKFIDNRLFLTEKGRDDLKISKHKDYSKVKGFNLPEEFKVKRLEINEPYLPDLTKLSKEILIL
jgi:hypothetical protein